MSDTRLLDPFRIAAGIACYNESLTIAFNLHPDVMTM